MIHYQRHDATDMQLSSINLRRFVGPEAREVFLLCRPEPLGSDDIIRQTESAYRMLQEVLSLEGGSPKHVVKEMVFFRNIRYDLNLFQQARLRVFGEAVEPHPYQPASIYIEQPPVDERLRVEISIFAVIPYRKGSVARNVFSTLPYSCAECSRADARVYDLGGRSHLHSGNVYGSPGTAYEEAYDMFCSAEGLLHQEGMNFRQVVRTWIHLRNMERDYAEFNRARRDFFRHIGVHLRPASTGIQGVPFPIEHNFSMSFDAIKSPEPLEAEAMSTSTLNEAWTYGSEFSRGLKVMESNKVALYISGTASVDEQGHTAHAGEFEAQVDRMIKNVSTLLSAQNASFHDVVSAVTYLKNPGNAPRLRKIFQNRGIEGFPNALVQASVCRPDLLCEMEAIAALPRPVMCE